MQVSRLYLYVSLRSHVLKKSQILKTGCAPRGQLDGERQSRRGGERRRAGRWVKGLGAAVGAGAREYSPKPGDKIM
jgi:hypothetical protein